MAQAAALHEELLRCEAEAAAQLAAESARRTQAEEAVEQYIAAHYASQAASQVFEGPCPVYQSVCKYVRVQPCTESCMYAVSNTFIACV